MANTLKEWKLPKGRFVIYDNAPSFFFNRVKQVHGNKIKFASSQSRILGEADGIVSMPPLHLAIPLAILTADCLPILILGQKGTAFLHAGWRGLQQKIISTPEVKAILPYYAFIGPHISSKSYEVGEHFKSNFPNSLSFDLYGEKVHFSLEREASIQLRQTYPNILIESAGLCTFEEKELFSFRRNKTEQRNWNIYIP